MRGRVDLLYIQMDVGSINCFPAQWSLTSFRTPPFQRPAWHCLVQRLQAFEVGNLGSFFSISYRSFVSIMYLSYPVPRGAICTSIVSFVLVNCPSLAFWKKGVESTSLPLLSQFWAMYA